MKRIIRKIRCRIINVKFAVRRKLHNAALNYLKSDEYGSRMLESEAYERGYKDGYKVGYDVAHETPKREFAQKLFSKLTVTREEVAK